jgi:hypothetical protein
MNQDEIYKFIGFIAVTMFFLYLISKALNLNLNFKKDVTEGLTLMSDKKTDASGKTATEAEKTQKKILDQMEKLKTNTQADADTLQTYKVQNKSDYNDILVYLYNKCGYELVGNILLSSGGLSADISSASSQTTIDKMNKLKQFMETIEYASKTLEGFPAEV